jgi:hypothetical protein
VAKCKKYTEVKITQMYQCPNGGAEVWCSRELSHYLHGGQYGCAERALEILRSCFVNCTSDFLFRSLERISIRDGNHSIWVSSGNAATRYNIVNADSAGGGGLDDDKMLVLVLYLDSRARV